MSFPAERVKSSARLSQALKAGFGIQYWGLGYSAENLSQAPHGLLIIEATRIGADHSETGDEVPFLPSEIQQINKKGERLVVGYLNLVEIEQYRNYWFCGQTSLMPPLRRPPLRPWLGPTTSQNERLALYWTDTWEDVLFQRVDSLMALGLDGLFLDDVLHYYSFAKGTDLSWEGDIATEPANGSYAAEMMGLIIRLADHIRTNHKGALVLVNNGVFIGHDAEDEIGEDAATELFSQYVKTIDGLVVESVLGPLGADTTKSVLLSAFRNRGVPVMTIDFETQFQDLPANLVRLTIDQQVTEHGFFSYVARNEAFDRLYPPSVTDIVTDLGP